MIATHIPKMLHPRLKQTAICAEILGDLPAGLMHSGTVEMRKRYWAAPANAAQLGIVRQQMAAMGDEVQPERHIPDLTDGRAKQLLIPGAEWRDGEYMSVTPVHSAGVAHEIFKRLSEHRLPYATRIIEPIPAAFGNHGEIMLLQAGRVRMLRRGVKVPQDNDWKGDFVQICAQVQSANIGNGMMSLGWPAVAAIGGAVHVIERETGLDVKFAIGMRHSSQFVGSLRGGRLKTGGEVVPDFDLSEACGHLDIVMLLQASDLDAVASAALELRRIAGGTILDAEVEICRDAAAPAASYLHHIPVEPDALTSALSHYGQGGAWTNAGMWRQPGGIGATITTCGYALLEQPMNRERSRGGYPHAWAEPVFSVVGQSPMQDLCWWQRVVTPGYAGYYGTMP